MRRLLHAIPSWTVQACTAQRLSPLQAVYTTGTYSAGTRGRNWAFVAAPASILAVACGQVALAEQKAPDSSVHVALPDGCRVLVIADPKVSDLHGKIVKPPTLPGPFQLPALPYSLDALEPAMSRTTLEFHWGKHHRSYVENLNKQVAGTPLESKTLEEVIVASWQGGQPTPVFNNAAQAYNHDFFWHSMKPGGGGIPHGDLKDAINRDFGGMDQFRERFKALATGQFGSGWAWLVTDSTGALKLMRTPNAGTPSVHGYIPLLTCDVWEHAYYLDYQNKRPDYVTAFLDHLVDWDTAEHRYAAAQGRTPP